MTRKVWWGDYTTQEFNGLDPDQVIAVLPVAAIEQHGPHLPVSTDTTIMEGMLKTVISRLPADLDVRILPIQGVGKSNEHIRAPGTLTINATTLIDHWCDLGASIARTGIRKVVVVNSHGGNEEIMGIVTREFRVRHNIMAVKTSWMRYGLPDGLFSETEQRYGIHGGDVETSLMLAFRPHCVDMDKALNFRSRVQDAEESLDVIRHTGQQAFAWICGDLNSDGVVGEAAFATAEKGLVTARHQAQGFIRLLQDFRALSVDEWLRG